MIATHTHTPRSMEPAHDPARGRLDALDGARAFALVLGIVFHASLSFVPMFIGWAVQDVSTSPWVLPFMTVSHTFRMALFFLLAGFFSHLTFHRKGTGEFVRSRLRQIVVPFVVGWFVLRPLLVSGWIMGGQSLRGEVDVSAGLLGGFQTLASLPAGIFTGSHLWFLYYLALISTLILVLRGGLSLTGSFRESWIRRADASVSWLAHSWAPPVILAAPIAGALLFMRTWGMDTPDQSLRPHLPALAIYGGFFLLGWMLSRRRELLAPFTRLTPARWILAALAITVMLLLAPIERDLGHPQYQAARLGYAVSYALTMGSLVILTLGAFGVLCRNPRGWVRYVADSSYWMYLIHLPLVVWLQVAVAELPLHGSIKLLIIVTLTIAIALLTYDLVVRATFLGWLLNGRRRERVLFPALWRRLRGLPREVPTKSGPQDQAAGLS